MRKHLSTVFAKQRDPYAGVDLANAGRFGGALWFLGALLSAVLLPIVPPTDAVGGAGWVVAACVIAGALLCGWRMRHGGVNLQVDELLVFSYLAIAGIAVLTWLSGGIDSPYAQLFVLSALYTCAIHPPRRVLAYLGAFALCVLLPVVYDSGLHKRTIVELVVELAVWLALAFVVMILMHTVRAQRLGLRREGEQARRQARVDPLTALLNRRAFDEDLATAIERARVAGEPLSVLVADLDGFKDFNDRFGHLEGDRVLEVVAAALRGALRRPDEAYRWGGDEFAVILPDAARVDAEHVADRVRVAVNKNAGPDGAALSIATGVAQFDSSAHEGAEALLAGADRALLRAKGTGEFELPSAHG